jgi:hypothetical protein
MASLANKLTGPAAFRQHYPRINAISSSSPSAPA